MSAPPKPPPPPPTKNSPKATAVTSKPVNRSFAVSKGILDIPQRIVVYGPGGVGKSTLCSLLPAASIRSLFIDIENSSSFLDVERVSPAPETWEEMRSILHNPDMLENFDAVVVDSFTKAEELGTQWTLENVKHEKGAPITSIESFGWGKGYVHVFETFLQVLCDLDAVIRSGKHVIVTCHDTTERVPNPEGEDWLQYQPRLQSPAKMGKIRERVKEWCDHLLYIGYDQSVHDGKARGSGTRTIYTAERPTFWAKSRCLSPDPIPYVQGDSTLWKQMFNKE